MLLGFDFLGYFVQREEFWVFFLVFSLLFGAVWLFVRLGRSWYWVFGLGLLIRLSLIFAFPALSDDFARFLWDGELLRLEQNPYAETPRTWLEGNPETASPYLENLFDLMNSKDYYSVYPPSNQLIFWVSSLGAELDPWQGIVSLRLLLLIAEIVLFFLFRAIFWQMKLSDQQLAWYWLNPLIILELTVNLHFEGLVLLALTAGIFFLLQRRWLAVGLLLGLAVGLKLLPLILLPALFFFLKKRELIRFSLGFAGMLLLCFGPLLITDSVGNFFQSLRLYQGKFEFNASIYYLLREIGFWIQGYNTIATLTKILSLSTLILIVWISWQKKAKSPLELLRLWEFAYLLYLLLQPIVHPWYLIPGLGLSLITRSKVFLAWSWLAIWSYQAYSNPNFEENPVFLTLEYLPLFIFIYFEYFSGKKAGFSTSNSLA